MCRRRPIERCQTARIRKRVGSRTWHWVAHAMNGALQAMGRKIHHDWARHALARSLPQLRDMPFEHEWYGTIGMTSNALPRFHELDHNVVSFNGFNGRGIAPGTLFGRELANPRDEPRVAGQMAWRMPNMMPV